MLGPRTLPLALKHTLRSPVSIVHRGSILLTSSTTTTTTTPNTPTYRPFSAAPARMTRVSEVIIQDHRDLEEAYNHIVKASNDDERTRWQNQFTWELARHSLGEELVIYPQFEKKLANGKEMADKDRKEHLTLKEHLYKFQKLKPNDPDFLPTIQTLWHDLEQHIKEEEEQDLVALDKQLDQVDHDELISSFKRTKKFVPTQSHPSAPDKPPFETVAGLMAAPIDHIKDLFKKFPKEAKSELPP